MEKQKTKKGDFVEIKYTGYYEGKPFDPNIKEDLEKINPEAKAEPLIIVISQKMVISGFDKALEDKELNKEYSTKIAYKEGFGERKRELVKTIPLNVFTKHKINPVPGSAYFLDNMLAKVITISGARVITDFNNPLAGKDLDYKFIIERVITEEKEKVERLLKFYLMDIPKYEIKENKIIVIGKKSLEFFINLYKEKFKEILGKKLEFEEEKVEEKT